MYSFWAMYSLRMSVCTVPRSAALGTPCPSPTARVEREQDRRGRVDRHRRRHLAERNPGEERLHVVERVDRHTLAPDLAQRAGMIRVVAHQRRHVERRREARLTVLEQVAEPLVRLRRRAEARELPHRPQPAPVHRRIHAAGERELARPAEVALVVDGDRSPAYTAARSRPRRSSRTARPPAPATRCTPRATQRRRRTRCDWIRCSPLIVG